MTNQRLIITPQTRVGELLDTYPELEGVLFELSPAFAKLKNPILRKTVARIATLQQAAIVGKLSVEEVVNRLRKEVGQDNLSEISETKNHDMNKPHWFSETRIVLRYNAIPVINSGESPMAEIFSRIATLKSDEIFELQTPFIPAPILEKLREKGFESYSVEKEVIVFSYFRRKEG